MPAITSNLSDRINMFLDRTNIEKDVGYGKIDYNALLRCISKGRPIVEATVFDMKLENDPIQKSVYRELEKEKIRIENPKGKCSDEKKQLGVDVALATKVVSRARTSNCDTIVIVSGDGDFIPVIEEVKASGKKIEFASYRKAANKSLIDICDDFTFLDELPIIIPEVKQ